MEALNQFRLVTSRCPQGRVLPLYAEGGGRDIEEAGAILAGRLQGRKARILLSLALANGYRDDVGKLCEQFGGYPQASRNLANVFDLIRVLGYDAEFRAGSTPSWGRDFSPAGI